MIVMGFSNWPDGWFLVDKPAGWTSFDVVNKLRRALRVKKAGHAGTLDPAATGLLILATGKNTRQIETVQGLDKTYTGTITLGQTSATYDQEGALTPSGDPGTVSDQQIRDQIESAFTGTIHQVPPMFSALKRDGKKLYELARQGKTITLEARPVQISRFDWTRPVPEQIHFAITCSKGTYIRSIAHDLGSALGCGGYLSDLRRTAIGPYQISEALDIETIIARFRQVAGEEIPT